MPETRPDVLARRIAGFGLPGTMQPVPFVVSDHDWRSLIEWVYGERITGLAVAAVEAGMLKLSEEQNVDLITGHRAAMAWALMVERTVLSVAEDLDAAGVPFVLLKGASLARTVYPDPEWRAFGDLDLLVRAPDWRSACAVFQRRGLARELPEPRRGFDERFGKAAVFEGADRIQIDLHQRLVLGPFGLWMDPDELFQHTAQVVIGGRSVPRLQDTELLLHVCMHASLGSNPPKLQPLRDILQVATTGNVDWQRFEELARRWNLRAVVRHAFLAAGETLDSTIPEPAEAIVAYRPTLKEQRLLEAYTTERRGRGGMAISTLAAIPTVGAKASYLRALLLPEREFLTARSGRGRLLGSRIRRLKVPAQWVKTGSRSR